MKNPVLTRVFSIVLAALGLVMILAGFSAFRKDNKDHQKDVRRYELLRSRAESFQLISDELEESGSYEDAKAELENLEEQHRKNVASHKQKLAEYTAACGMISEEMDKVAWQKTELFAILGSVEGMDYNSMSKRMEKEFQDYLKAVEVRLADMDIEEIEAMIAKGEIPEIDFSKDTDAIKDIINQPEIQYVSGMANEAMTYLPALLEESYLLQAQLANEETARKLLEAKNSLADEITQLEEKREEVNHIRSNEKKIASLKVHLLDNDYIKENVDKGQGIMKAANEALPRIEKENRLGYLALCTITALMTIGGLGGVACVPAAFEKVKKHWRFWLVFPALLCTVCAIIAECLNMLAGRGQLYGAYGAIIFGIVQSILVLQKDKKNDIS